MSIYETVIVVAPKEEIVIHNQTNKTELIPHYIPPVKVQKNKTVKTKPLVAEIVEITTFGELKI
jgi:hypothetical protein